MTTAICYACLTKQIIQKENILFMFYHIHGRLNLWNILFMFHHIHVTFEFREFGAAVSNFLDLVIFRFGVEISLYELI